MSLNFDVSKCPDFTSLWDENDQLKPVPNQLILSIGLIADVGELTEKTFDEVYFRLKVIEKVYGALFRGPEGEDVLISRDMLAPLIGLRMNVASTTRAKFMKRMAASLADEVASAIRRESK